MSLADDFRLLELPMDATEQDAKAAYRRLARRYHPDKNPGVDTTEHFQRLQDAYNNVLSAMKRAPAGTGQGQWQPYEFTNRAKASPFDESGYEFASDAQQRQFVQEQQRAYQEMKRNSAQQERTRDAALKTARNTLHERRVKALYEEMQKHQKPNEQHVRSEQDFQDFFAEVQAAEQRIYEKSHQSNAHTYSSEYRSDDVTQNAEQEKHQNRAAKAVFLAASYVACFGAGVYSTLYWQDQTIVDNAETIPYVSGLYPQFREGVNHALTAAKLYSEPSVEASELTIIPASADVQSFKLQGDWLTLRYGDETGWAKAEQFGFGSYMQTQTTGCFGHPGLAPSHGAVLGNANGNSRLRLLNQLNQPSILHFESLDGQAPFKIYLQAAQPLAANFIPRGRYRLVLETGSLYHGACQQFLFENRSRILLDSVDFASTEQSLTLRALTANP